AHELVAPKYKMESNQQVIRPVPAKVGAPGSEGRDSYSWITRQPEAGRQRPRAKTQLPILDHRPAARLIRKDACRQIARGMIQLLEAAFVFLFADRFDGSSNLHCSRRPLRCSYSKVAAQSRW